MRRQTYIREKKKYWTIKNRGYKAYRTECSGTKPVNKKKALLMVLISVQLVVVPQFAKTVAVSTPYLVEDYFSRGL